MSQHLEFIAGTAYCPVKAERVQTGLPYGVMRRDGYVCPGCGAVVEPAKRRAGERGA